MQFQIKISKGLFVGLGKLILKFTQIKPKKENQKQRARGAKRRLKKEFIPSNCRIYKSQFHSQESNMHSLHWKQSLNHWTTAKSAGRTNP